MGEQEVGRVEAYFAKAGAAGIAITGGSLRVGDTIRIKGHTTDLTQRIDSLEIDRKPIAEARPGQTVGVKLAERARPGDVVYRVTPD